MVQRWNLRADGIDVVSYNPQVLGSKDILARNVTRLLRQRGWSQRELARRADVSSKTINYICNPDTTGMSTGLDRLDAVAHAFSIRDPWLLLLEEFDTRVEPGAIGNLVRNYLNATDEARVSIERIARVEATQEVAGVVRARRALD